MFVEVGGHGEEALKGGHEENGSLMPTQAMRAEAAALTSQNTVVTAYQIELHWLSPE